MGSSGSKDLNQPLIGYKFPTDRAKVRHNPDRSQDERLHVDVLGDVYDYLIIFSRPDDAGVGGLSKGTADEAQAKSSAKTDRISWNDIELLWFQAVPG
eukprot:CAMPEP_0197395632 /NCGR_PEP_ID=MMETSP1165-20131217/7184_1 /TAXON_ID=284809 /ORGANISM="Chrysocystis fragilis, Strain CCMP3189" /LENGTH=97 /DNA_ID=CAMNT_0042921399 /DNA_START=124 /DNA_END=413 /DNA_ORIENTATION=+